jgi:hypothetical protein
MHKGNEIKKGLSISNEDICDCGRVDQMISTAFCKKHKDFNKIIELEIKE